MIPQFSSKPTHPEVHIAPPLTSIQQHELAAALKNHEPIAILKLYDSYSATLYGIIRRHVQDDVRAMKVLETTFERAYSSFHQYNPSTTGLFTWLNRLARQLSSEDLSYDQMQKDEIPESQSQGKVTHKIIYVSCRPGKSAVHQPSGAREPEYRIILNLVFFQGFEIEEIAKQCSLPVQEVKMRLAKALRQLRNERDDNQQ